jgi:2'-5' RNA ligase
MARLIIAYPQLADADYTWVQAIRQQYDPQVALVEPHITLVFPFTTIPHEHAVDHLLAVTREVRPISLIFRCAMVVKDDLSPLTHVFLVPDEGLGALVKLHNQLYTDILAPELRLDIPFVPHITIGGFTDPLLAKELADSINRENISIESCVKALDLILYENNTVTTLHRIILS